ncbi:MAG TPA: ABC transporter substrate-binding protein [Acetobacteraceae bacterium]|nr:ABC transporter substrate-binding protein [Acetobacteraceae bacterium]
MLNQVTRRAVLAGTAALAMPAIVRAQPGPIKIGLIHPVTGALAYGGQLCRTGGQTAIEDINAEGGIKSMGGAKLEALLGDAQGRPEIGASLVDQMNEQGAAGFTGCFASAIGLAATQAAAKYGTPFCIDSGIADSITGRGLKNVFRLFPTASGTTADALAALDAINKGAGSPAKTAILVHEDSEFGTNTAKALAGKLDTIGIKVLEIIPHATPTRDFSNIVLRIKAAKPDLVVPTSYNNEYILLARTLVQQRVELAGIVSVAGGGFNLRFAKEQPQVAQDIIDVNHWLNPRAPDAAAFRKKFEDKGATFGFEVLFGYFAVRFLADAIQRAGSADKAKVIEALASSTYRSDLLPYGPTKIVDGQNQNAHAVALQIQGGDIKVVYPEQFADAKVVFPRPKA